MFWAIPIASPAVHAIVNDVKFANSAAVSAGTTASGSTLGSSCDTGATSTPRAPTIRLAISVLAIESRLGEADEHRRGLVLECGPRLEPEARPAVERREPRGDHDHDAREIEAI